MLFTRLKSISSMVGKTCAGSSFHSCLLLISLVLIFKCIHQMRLGSVFGAFLDPVADKVGPSSLFKFILITLAQLKEIKSILLSSDMVQIFLINYQLHFFITAYGCCHPDPTLYPTFGGFCVWSYSLASDCTFNSHYWQGGNKFSDLLCIFLINRSSDPLLAFDYYYYYFI